MQYTNIYTILDEYEMFFYTSDMQTKWKKNEENDASKEQLLTSFREENPQKQILNFNLNY